METIKGQAEGKVILPNVSWETYERLLADHQERPVPRFFYEKGVLEIVSPSTEHEVIGRLCALLLELLGEELGYDVLDAGHTTFRREDLQQGFEPDGSFYFAQNADRIRGVVADRGDIDLSCDPPPDLVVEVDLTSPSLDKLPIYARIGVGEVWRYAAGRMEILGRAERASRGYEPMAESRCLPVHLTHEVLSGFIEEGLRSRRPDWLARVRQWARQSEAADHE